MDYRLEKMDYERAILVLNNYLNDTQIVSIDLFNEALKIVLREKDQREVRTDRNTKERILRLANEAVNGDRNVQYGDPNQDFTRTAVFWNEVTLASVEKLLLERSIDLETVSSILDILRIGNIDTASSVALKMILLKVSRQTHQNKEDNWIDIAGYAACGAECDY